MIKIYFNVTIFLTFHLDECYLIPARNNIYRYFHENIVI